MIPVTCSVTRKPQPLKTCFKSMTYVLVDLNPYLCDNMGAAISVANVFFNKMEKCLCLTRQRAVLCLKQHNELGSRWTDKVCLN